MKKYLALAILLITCSLSVSAQKTKDALFLKNGSVIYGQLLEADGENYKIRSADGSIFVFPAGDVEKFAKAEAYFEGRKSQGFTFSLESGVLVGSVGSGPAAPFSFNFLLGTTVNTSNIFSFGSGVEFIERAYTPFFAEYKRIINDRKTSPFIFLRGGAVVPLGDSGEEYEQDYYGYGPKDYKGGLSLAAGTGISWAKPDYETYLSFAYRYVHTGYERKEGTRGNVTYNFGMNRLEIKLGFKF